MKHSIVLFGSAVLFVQAAFGQGSLTPPGAPVPSMKTLSQVEPRIPVSTPTNLNVSGSYYLTTNITGSNFPIDITADNVTFDLNGFSIVGNSGVVGVSIFGAHTNVCIKNGNLRGWVNGAISGLESDNCQFDHLNFSHNGRAITAGTNSVITACSVSDGSIYGLSVERGSIVAGCTVRRSGGTGIYVGDGSTVKDCTVVENTYGIVSGAGCTIHHCTLFTNLNDGIVCGKGCTVNDCTLERTAGRGIVLEDGCSANNCTLYYSHDVGIRAHWACTIMNCTVDYGDNDGILVEERCLVIGNNCTRNGYGSHAGIRATGQRNKIDSNNLNGNVAWGLVATNTANLIIRNTASAHTFNYSIAANNSIGEILNYAGPSYTITNANPWANIQY